MPEKTFKYRIFDCVIDSDLELPELPPADDTDDPGQSTVVFRISSCPSADKPAPEWFHHWHLPDGRISLSCGKILELYYLQFPQLADFEISTHHRRIRCFPAAGVDTFAIRHLLLDQVIPRLLSHRGQLILHASGVCFKGEALLFLGETGHGKSTLSVALQQYGVQLITDDCVKLNFTTNHVHCIPNYGGARLWPDSLDAVRPQYHKNEPLGTSKKVRLYFPCKGNTPPMPLPVRAIFVLDTSIKEGADTPCSIRPISGSGKFTEINKHCFPLDITNKVSTSSRFHNMAQLASRDTILFSALRYQKDYAALPDICRAVLSAAADHSRLSSKQQS